MQIGNVELKNNIFLAPMAGVTDSAFRILCKEMGAGLVFTEMISAKGLYYGDRKTNNLTNIDPRERPVALQIFGSDPSIMAKVVEEYINTRDDIDILDINMGCPAPKIVKNGDGSALLKNLALIRKILKEVIKVSVKPVTVKIRIGWNNSNINALEVAKIIEDEGADAIIVHGRTRDMFYSGEADWNIIKDIKNKLNIPVIGNGDLFTAKDVFNMLKFSKCDGVAIGRGSRGNPWIFSQTTSFLKGEKVFFPDDEDKINMAIKHLELVCDLKGEEIGVKEMRKHIAWYIKGMRNSAQLKNRINTIEHRIEMKEELLKFSRGLKN